jgi:hypothetical protein
MKIVLVKQTERVALVAEELAMYHKGRELKAAK